MCSRLSQPYTHAATAVNSHKIFLVHLIAKLAKKPKNNICHMPFFLYFCFPLLSKFKKTPRPHVGFLFLKQIPCMASDRSVFALASIHCPAVQAHKHPCTCTAGSWAHSRGQPKNKVGPPRPDPCSCCCAHVARLESHRLHRIRVSATRTLLRSSPADSFLACTPTNAAAPSNLYGIGIGLEHASSASDPI